MQRGEALALRGLKTDSTEGEEIREARAARFGKNGTRRQGGAVSAPIAAFGLS